MKLNTEVSGIEKENDTYKIETNNGVIEAKYICNAAGVFADKVNEMCNEKTFEITPNKGEYYLMDKSQGNLVNHVIFQCPNEKRKRSFSCSNGSWKPDRWTRFTAKCGE